MSLFDVLVVPSNPYLACRFKVIKSFGIRTAVRALHIYT